MQLPIIQKIRKILNIISCIRWFDPAVLHPKLLKKYLNLKYCKMVIIRLNKHILKQQNYFRTFFIIFVHTKNKKCTLFYKNFTQAGHILPYYY